MFLWANAYVMFRETELQLSCYDESDHRHSVVHVLLTRAPETAILGDHPSRIFKSDCALLEITEISAGLRKPSQDEQVLWSFNNCLTDFAVGYSIATEIRETVPGHDGFIGSSRSRPQRRHTTKAYCVAY